MTPANPDALVDARDLIRQSLKVGAPGLSEAAREAVVRSITLKLEGKVLAPLLADLQQQAASISSLEESVNSLEADLQRVTAERDADQAEHARYRASAEEMWETAKRHGGQMLAEKRRADAAEARAAQLQAEVEALKEDAARLDFLDGCNARLNASYGTHYGWKLVLNHNVNRLMLGDMKVDLHDSEGGNDKLPSCRLAIDEARARAARAATVREGA